jgi:hypothetical protein
LLQECDISCKLGDEIFIAFSSTCSKSWQFCTKAITPESSKFNRKLGIHGKTCIDYSAIEQIVTFCPDLRELSLPQIADAVRYNVIEIAFHKCRFLETLKIYFETFNIE